MKAASTACYQLPSVKHSGLKLQAEWAGHVNKAEHHQWVARVSLPCHIHFSLVGSFPGPVTESLSEFQCHRFPHSSTGGN